MQELHSWVQAFIGDEEGRIERDSELWKALVEFCAVVKEGVG